MTSPSLVVRYQVERSVLRTGDRLRVSAQVMRADGIASGPVFCIPIVATKPILQSEVTAQPREFWRSAIEVARWEKSRSERLSSDEKGPR